MSDEKAPMSALDKILHFLGMSGAGIVIAHVAGLVVVPTPLLIAGAAVGYAGGALAASMFGKGGAK